MQGWLTVFLKAEEKQGSIKTPSQAQPLLDAENISIKPHEMCKTNTILVATTAEALALSPGWSRPRENWSHALASILVTNILMNFENR